MTPTLSSAKLVETAEKVRARIAERFPGAGLADVAGGVVDAARAASERAAAIAEPNRWLRAGQGLLVLTALAAAVAYFLTLPDGTPAWRTALEFLDAAKGSAAVLVAAAVFLFTLETRLKRHRALRAVHELRALAHIIDMHQLGKDPTQIGRPADSLEVAGKALDAESMRLYLHACTGLLAVVSKLGQLYVQDFSDPAAVTAVDQFEGLATGLSSKIWQKLMILDRVEGTPVAVHGEHPAAPLDLPNGETMKDKGTRAK